MEFQLRLEGKFVCVNRLSDQLMKLPGQYDMDTNNKTPGSDPSPLDFREFICQTYVILSSEFRHCRLIRTADVIFHRMW